MSDITWYAEPVEIPIGSRGMATSLLVGLGENSEQAERAAIVLRSVHLDVEIALRVRELGELVEALGDLYAAMRPPLVDNRTAVRGRSADRGPVPGSQPGNDLDLDVGVLQACNPGVDSHQRARDESDHAEADGVVGRRRSALAGGLLDDAKHALDQFSGLREFVGNIPGDLAQGGEVVGGGLHGSSPTARCSDAESVGERAVAGGYPRPATADFSAEGGES